MTDLVVCESTAAIVAHLRRVTEATPIKLSGHAFPRPLSLCGNEIAWDTRLPIDAASCRACLAVHATTAAGHHEEPRQPMSVGSGDRPCEQCRLGIPLIWFVQEKDYFHEAPGLSVRSCDAIDYKANRLERKRRKRTGQ